MQLTPPALDRCRRVLVVGGTGGIGGAISRAFADQGCHVVATGQQPAEVAAFDSAGRSIETCTLDITAATDVSRLVGRFSQLDVLVNCAGLILRDGAEHDMAGFEQVIAVNLSGLMRVCTSCRPLLIASRGCVVNLASMLSFFGSGHAPAYSASKGGVAQLTKSLAIAWAEHEVRVNAVAPGWIATELTAPLIANAARHDAIVARTPLGRWGQPDDVAGAVLFLCSPAARFITGVILPVDGGYSIA